MWITKIQFSRRYCVYLKKNQYIYLNSSYSHIHCKLAGHWGTLTLGFRLNYDVTIKKYHKITHDTKKSVKCIFCGTWAQNLMWNFIGARWNFTQKLNHSPQKLRITRCKNFDELCELWYLTSHDIPSHVSDIGWRGLALLSVMIRGAFQYKDVFPVWTSHHKNKPVVRPHYLYNEKRYTRKDGIETEMSIMRQLLGAASGSWWCAPVAGSTMHVPSRVGSLSRESSPNCHCTLHHFLTSPASRRTVNHIWACM